MEPVIFSRDCTRWGLLPPPTEEMRAKAKLAKGRFTGDPSYEFEHVEVKKIGEGEDATEEEETVICFDKLLKMHLESKMFITLTDCFFMASHYLQIHLSISIYFELGELYLSQC